MKGLFASTLWLVSVVMVVWLASSTDATEPSCPPSCSCNREDQNEYEVACPSNNERIALKLLPNKTIFSCQVNTVSEDFNLLKHNGIEIERSVMEFRLCPLPDLALTELLQIRDAFKIQTFIYSSYRKYNHTLEKKIFSGLTGITSLSLSNNGLTALAPDLLMDMPHLKQIFFLNNLVQLPEDLFQPALNLTLIELGKNNLTDIPTGLFRHLKKLDILNLWKNRLSNLSAKMFEDLISLTSLDLRHNKLTSLPDDIFIHLTSLKNLRLDGNNLQTLPAGLFSSNKALERVMLSDNRETNLKLPNELFANLPNLTTVDLNNAGITELPNNLFLGSSKLISISMKNNRLKKISQEVFKSATELEKMNLANNQIMSLPEQVFQNCAKLKNLDISFNKITNLSKRALDGLVAMEELNLENNELSFIDWNAFPHDCKLHILNLANNKLTFGEKSPESQGPFADNSPLQDCKELEKIDLSYNSIYYIFSDWRSNFSNLRLLNLSHNALKNITFSDVAFNSHRDRTIDISHNKISRFVLDDLKDKEWALANKDNFKKAQRWLLNGNSFSCNCSNYGFFSYLAEKFEPLFKKFVKIETGDLLCDSRIDGQLKKVTDIKIEDIRCPLDHLTSLDPSLKLECPLRGLCSCSYRPADYAVLIDCKGKGLTEPPTLPTTNNTEWWKRTVLDLSNNQLTQLPDGTRAGYEMVSELLLGRNVISKLNGTRVLQLPKVLQHLDLHDNNLTVIDGNALEALRNRSHQLTKIIFEGNPWQCDCGIQSFVRFVRQNSVKTEAEKINCNMGPSFETLDESGLCNTAGSIVLSIAAALLLGALIGASFAVYYKYNREIKSWLYAHNMCLWLVTEEELDKDKVYDAFVSYSHKDEDFVVNDLVPNLEGGSHPFKLCLHYRDWLAGGYIPNQITKSVEDSRRTIVILSPNFLESVWGRLEFRAAHCQALNEGRARVIVVLLGDIGPTDNLDPELRAYLNMNTYVKWGDPWFWNKLRYALPHPAKAVQGSIGLVNSNTENSNGKLLDEKLDLICEPNGLSPVTIPQAEGYTSDPECMKNALNGALSSPRKVMIPKQEANGTAAAVG